MDMTLIIQFVGLFICAYIQNMAFTAVSRSRNSGDPSYHRWCAVASNSVWFFTQLLFMSVIWPALTQGEGWKIGLAGAVYVIATTEGSVRMMKIMLKKETGKRKVGAV
jgi:hypothetical protein